MKSWEEIADPPLEFPIRGKTYTAPEVDYLTGLTIEKVKRGDETDLDGMAAEETWRLVLGSAYDEMVADNVPGEALARAGLSALVDYEQGREAAILVWENGVDPKALMAAIQKRSGKPSSTPAAGASATRSPASTSGTSSRPASTRKPRSKQPKKG